MSIDTTPDGTETVEWDWGRVVPGEVIKVDADPDEDIAPGVIEVRPYQPPAVYRAGSAAMVVAAKTGRAVGLAARGTWNGTRWIREGVRSTCVLGYRYVRAHDYQEAIGGITSGSDWNRAAHVRRKRWTTLGVGAALTGALNLTGWWALVKYAGMTAIDSYSWAILPGAEGVAAAALVTLYGRYRCQNPGIAPEQLLADEDTDDGEEPFPLAWCTSPGQVEECVSRALYAEGIDTRSMRLLAAAEWGKEIDVVLKGSTPGKVNAAAEQLDVHFNIKQGGTLIDPDPRESAHIVLRLVTSNPFANMPKPQVHAPNSLDITDPHNFGRCMDSSPLDLVLEGLRILAIGVSGAAKTTGVLRDLAEVITACHNAIALDLDPVKDGLREFEGVMAAPPIRGHKACEKWLGHLVKMAKGRNIVRNRLGMGDTWVATREHPAIFPFVDEYIYLSPKGKELFIELLRIGKQSGIYPIAAGQDATSDSMGDAIADTFTLRIMLAARWDDIRIVFGQGAAAKGFRPDRLVPAQNKEIKNDAGQSYIKGPGLTRPLLYGWNEHSNESIKRAVADRKAAGRPWFDRDTLAAAGLLNLANGGETADGSQIVTDAITVMTDAEVDRMRTEVLAEALAEYDPDAYGDLSVSDLRKLLREVGAGAPVPLGALDGMENPRGYKLDILTALT